MRQFGRIFVRLPQHITYFKITTMKKSILFFIAFVLFISAKVTAQDGYNERAKKYVEQFYPLAIAEQKKTGIPASITLGQGILETEAGASELMTQANNHFGIKCKNGWAGPTFTHTDDAPDECFKKYTCAEESYRDHSLHLQRNPRYSPLFALSATDYASWAVCLKKCGYATSPQYAQRLIKIIEDFKLQEYTYAALDSNNSGYYPTLPLNQGKTADALVVNDEKEEAPPTPAPKNYNPGHNKAADAEPDATAGSSESEKFEMINGLKAFYAYKGEQLVKYADQYHIRYSRLLEMNDMPDAPLPFDCYVYVEKKLTYGTHEKHIVNYGESLLQISQVEGIQYKKLLALNMLSPNEEPVTGTILELQKTASSKPNFRVNELQAHKGNAIDMSAINTPARGDGYLASNTPKAGAAKHTTTASDPADGFETTNWPETTPPPAKKRQAPPKTANASSGDGFETTDWPETTPPPTKKTASPAKKTTTADKADGFETSNWPETTTPPAKKQPAPAKTATASNGDGFETSNWPETTPPPAKKRVVTGKTPSTTADKGDGFETTNWPDTPPVAAKAGNQPKQESAVKNPAANPSTTAAAVARKENGDKKPVAKTQGAQQDEDGDEDLDNLKADMDKVVYADNSKLTKEKMSKPQAAKKQPISESKPIADGTAKYYTIKKGETAFSIAKKNNISVDELLKMNDIDASGIKAGYKIQVK
jgi:LysM repeat protein